MGAHQTLKDPSSPVWILDYSQITGAPVVHSRPPLTKSRQAGKSAVRS